MVLAQRFMAHVTATRCTVPRQKLVELIGPARLTPIGSARDGIVTVSHRVGTAVESGLSMTALSCRRHRFPPSITQHAIWLYLRFTLSYRDVEELLA
jgi:hypothetical protein